MVRTGAFPRRPAKAQQRNRRCSARSRGSSAFTVSSKRATAANVIGSPVLTSPLGRGVEYRHVTSSPNDSYTRSLSGLKASAIISGHYALPSSAGGFLCRHGSRFRSLRRPHTSGIQMTHNLVENDRRDIAKRVSRIQRRVCGAIHVQHNNRAKLKNPVSAAITRRLSCSSPRAVRTARAASVCPSRLSLDIGRPVGVQLPRAHASCAGDLAARRTAS
jgi:hypothetical protein